MIRQLLQSPSLDFITQAQVKKAMRYDWCWPREQPLQERLAALGLEKPSGPPPGEALLVSATPASGAYRLGLWRLRRRPASAPTPSTSEAHFVNDARRALRVAEQVVTRGLPFILSMEPLQAAGDWCAELIHKEGAELDVALDGSSYGLSILLAAASLLMQVPLPSDLAASATLAEDGSLGPVQSLPEKVSFLAGSALGVRRLVVAESQVEEARGAVAGCKSSLAVVGARKASDAFAAAFGDVHQRLSEPWTSDDIQKAARKLYLLALSSSSPILDWKAVARGAELLLLRLERGGTAHAQAEIARQIARRHTGEPGPLPWPTEDFLQGLNRPLRDVHLAHVLQAANDTGAAELAEFTQRIRDWLPSTARECYEPQLILRGAVGRALAALRRYEDARDLLRETVEAWRELGKLQDASHSLCELVRVIGVLGEPDALRSLEPLLHEFRNNPHISSDSRGFLRLALGRTHVLTGQPQGALVLLGDAGEFHWGTMRDDIQRSRCRWLARAEAATGRPEKAEVARLGLEEGSVEVLLARLDRALERGEKLEPLLARLREHPEIQQVSRLLEGLSEPRALAERLSREYPY